jgi:hypothetical protein
VLKAIGGLVNFSAGSGQTTFLAIIDLRGTIDPNDLSPKADYVAFSYEFTNDQTQTLKEAIETSAELTKGSLMLGTNLGGGGDLSGFYAVPAPSALALIGVGGLMGRRRRN